MFTMNRLPFSFLRVVRGALRLVFKGVKTAASRPQFAHPWMFTKPAEEKKD
jgi:hypothetical protein